MFIMLILMISLLKNNYSLQYIGQILLKHYSSYIPKNFKKMSGNRNMADYTNFDGKTNKRIVQAPGGASSFSLAWSNQPTDYGQERHYRKQSREKYQQYQQPRQQERPEYNEPMRVMDQPPKSYGSRNIAVTNQQYDARLGGEHGYGNYNNSPQINQPMMGGYNQPDPRQGYGNYGNYKNSPNIPVEQLDIAVQQQKIFKGQRPPSVPRHDAPPMQGKSSIKINGPPKQNHIFGNQDYNYWKDPANDSQKKQQNGSEKRINSQQYQGYSQKSLHGNGQKTSVKVHNPPGGKQTFTFG